MSNSGQNIHRLLSGAPFLAAAVGAILATAFPLETGRLFWQANDALGVPLVKYACFAGAVFYFLAWWMTSRPSQTTRKKNQKFLRRSQQRLKDLQQQLIVAGSQGQFEAILSELQIAVDEIEKWIAKNMSAEAVSRFNNPDHIGARFNYAGQAPTDPNFYNQRDNILKLNADRLAELEYLIRNDGWDK